MKQQGKTKRTYRRRAHPELARRNMIEAWLVVCLSDFGDTPTPRGGFLRIGQGHTTGQLWPTEEQALNAARYAVNEWNRPTGPGVFGVMKLVKIAERSEPECKLTSV